MSALFVEIKVPPLGESVTEATVAKWFKAAGDGVVADEPLVELETDKVTVEVPAPKSGTLTAIKAAVGETVAVGAVLGILTEGASGVREPPHPVVAPVALPPEGVLSPAVRRMVTEQNLNPAVLPATGRGGRLTKEDVITFQERAKADGRAAPSAAPHDGVAPSVALHDGTAPSVAPVPPSSRGEERVRMTRLRQRIATRLKEAQNTAAMLTTFNEVDMTEVTAWRNRHRGAFEKKYTVRLGFMSFFTKACVAALKAFPAVNAEIDGADIVYKNYYHIGVAVGTAQGLVVPVVRDADLQSFAALEAEIAGLGQRARDGTLKIEDLSGGTFTITNGGVYGSLLSTPILNPPQSAILGMHKIQQRPVVMPDGSIQAKPMMYVALSYDHRIIDGREAVSFLVRVKECIEEPARLLLEI
ncbi:MAG: 2-oxoglutarate dehydrogenase E2 component (dihydrolipoamide succinyltransferase) [Rhodospirillaceae bacterium]|nr:MAG: 2-oxoglutarate dehydrogenase E2 component (dihydrolipoamide succinyltransferase) [Rhodospirillaceae bacterium]